MVFLPIKSLPNLLFGVICLPGDQSHPFAQPTINPLACCIRWAGLLGRAVFPPWNEGPNFGSYNIMLVSDLRMYTSQICENFSCKLITELKSSSVREEQTTSSSVHERKQDVKRLGCKILLLPLPLLKEFCYATSMTYKEA